MRLQGFTLSDVEITVDATSYDLHNNFNFTGFSYEVETRTLSLKWHRGIGDWVPTETPCSLEILMHRVRHFSASPRDSTKPFTEDDCLGTVVVVVAADKPLEQSYGAIDGVSNLGDDIHLVFEFMSGFAVRVQAEEATCVVV